MSWNLSDQVELHSDFKYKNYRMYREFSVKEFIKRLKILLKDAFEMHEVSEDEIDELAGDKLK